MAATLTITSVQGGLIPDGIYVAERIKVVGSSSAAADTGTYTTPLSRVVGIEGGDFAVSQSGYTLTITANAAQASTTTYAKIFGYG